jgi:hypothetical protein
MSETSFWNYLRKLLPREGHYTRVESHDTSAGFPDVHFTLNGNSGTIELKDAKRPGARYPFKGGSGLRASQVRWMADEIDKADGQVYLALQCGDRVYLLNAALYYDELARMTEEDIDRAASVKWKKGRKVGKSNISDEECPTEMQLRDFLESAL